MLAGMKLAAYMELKKIKPGEMAVLIGDCSASGVIKWMRDERTPRPAEQRRIFAATAGAVSPNDFVLDDMQAAS
jgi:hypothetical protein